MNTYLDGFQAMDRMWGAAWTLDLHLLSALVSDAHHSTHHSQSQVLAFISPPEITSRQRHTSHSYSLQYTVINLLNSPTACDLTADFMFGDRLLLQRPQTCNPKLTRQRKVNTAEAFVKPLIRQTAFSSRIKAEFDIRSEICFLWTLT